MSHTLWSDMMKCQFLHRSPKKICTLGGHRNAKNTVGVFLFSFKLKLYIQKDHLGFFELKNVGRRL
jgi:hypothetical protein